MDDNGDASSVLNTTSITQEEGVLHDVLNELDKERKKRAELEAELRSLRKATAVTAASDGAFTISRKHYIALQAELQGYRQLLEAITCENPAVAAAMEAMAHQKVLGRNASLHRPKTLPLHLVKMLEIMPWHKKLREFVIATEEVYEWEFYDEKIRCWVSEKQGFLKALPTVEPAAGSNALSDGSHDKQKDRPFLNFLARSESMSSAPLSQSVLSNCGLTKLLNIKNGYPLPQIGEWEWVGGWRVEKRVFIVDKENAGTVDEAKNKRQRSTIDCDDDGWSYAKEPTHFLVNPSEMCWDNPGCVDKGICTKPNNNENCDPETCHRRTVRRRKWTRQRALVNYPHACEKTREFLQLLAQNSSLTLAVNKISEQLVDTKMALTEAESSLMQSRDELTIQVQMLREVLERDLATSSSTPGDQAPGAGKTQKDVLKWLNKISVKV